MQNAPIQQLLCRGVQQRLRMSYLCSRPTVVAFPNRMGQRLRGVEHAPGYLADLNHVPHENLHPVWCTDNVFENLAQLYATNVQLLRAALDNGKPGPEDLHARPERRYGGLINLGGDHSMSIASVAATLTVYPDAKVLWFDAHPDLNTHEWSVSKNLHGMPLAFLSGLEHQLTRRTPFLTAENELDLESQLMYVGVRDVDLFEADAIDRHGIPVLTVEEVEARPDECVRRIREWAGDAPVHLSFDVDVVDPAWVPSTGTPVDHGLQKHTAAHVLTALVDAGVRTVNMDVTELNIDMGCSARSARNVSDILARYFYPAGDDRCGFN